MNIVMVDWMQGVGMVSVIVVDMNGCFLQLVMCDLVIFVVLDVQFMYVFNDVDYFFIDGMVNVVNWIWNFGDGVIFFIENFFYIFVVGIIYLVMFMVIDNNGCFVLLI